MNIIPDRNQLIQTMPHNCVCAEVGVFKGTFSRYICDTVEPQHMYLIDTWNQDGMSEVINGHSQITPGESVFTECLTLFKEELDRGKIEILRGDSVEMINGLPHDSLDFIYLDADHKYSSVLPELEVSFHKVKNGGWILGHDYCMIYNFGVVRAVAVFCDRHNLEINVLTNEPLLPIIGKGPFRLPSHIAYNSFGIQIKK